MACEYSTKTENKKMNIDIFTHFFARNELQITTHHFDGANELEEICVT